MGKYQQHHERILDIRFEIIRTIEKDDRNGTKR